ncbi:MAG: hypothetical protein SFV15_15885 [Polyangiaceae bacterium]|nr:hypothetical protein [Polyangiaceae bacterium]
MARFSEVLRGSIGLVFMFGLVSSSGCGGVSSGTSSSGAPAAGGSAMVGVLPQGTGGKGTLGTGGGGQAPAEAGVRAYIAAIPGKACLRQGLSNFGNPAPSNTQTEGVPLRNGVDGAVVNCTITGTDPSYAFSVTAGAAGSSVFLSGTVTNGTGTIASRDAVFSSEASGTQTNIEPCTARTLPMPGASEKLRIGAGEMFAEINCPSIHDEGDPMTTNCNALGVLVHVKNCGM